MSGADQAAFQAREDVRRLAALSDGVMAFAMTLLVVDLARPAQNAIHSGADLHAALTQWNAYASLALSFAVIARYWVAHYRVFRRLKRVDTPLLVLNLVFLAGITFLPFPTAVLQNFASYRSAVMLYAGTLAVIGLVWAALWNHAATSGLLTGDEGRVRTLFDVLETPVIFLASIGIAWFSPGLALRSWILIAVVNRIRAIVGGRRRRSVKPTPA